jgi:gluconolactonase
MPDHITHAISRRAFGLTGAAASLLAGSAQAQTAPLPLSMAPSKDQVFTTDIPGVTAAGEPFTIMKSGMTSSEGAVAAPDGGLYFSEPSVNRIYKVGTDDTITVLFDPHKVDDAKGERWRLPSLGVDSKGVIYACRRANGPIGVAIVYPTAKAKFIATSYKGVPFNAPNDLVVTRAGGIYFTEPGSPDQGAQRPHHIYYIKPSGEVVVGTDNLGHPNGLALSPHEQTLYAVDSESEYVFAFDVMPDHSLANRRQFGRLNGIVRTDKGMNNGIDGMTVDNDGRVYVISMGGIEVFTPKGENIGTIKLPVKAQNLAFSGKDGRTLYVVGHGNLFKVRTLARKVVGRAK